MKPTQLASLTLHPLIVPMTRSFGIAGGTQEIARNILVRIILADGTVGLGEAAPFPAASGETFDGTWTALQAAEGVLRTATDWSDARVICAALGEELAGAPAALCGVEIAVFDAMARQKQQSLLTTFGGKSSRLRTDITIVTGSAEEARADAERAAAEGFTTLKLKVGAADIDEDARRLRAVLTAAPGVSLVLDANAAYTSDQALELLGKIGSDRSRIALFEQPVAAGDWEGLQRVEGHSGIRVAADESLRSRNDFATLVKMGGVSAINIKTAKLGVLVAWDLLLEAQSKGFAIMVGGMVETELAMSTSACLAAGVGGVEFIDLDTPLFLGPRPLSGGFAQTGPDLELSNIDVGHGVSFTGSWAP